MLVGGVIDDEIDEDAEAALLAAVGEFDEVAEGAVAGVDAVVVGYVVAVVAAGGGLEGHEPDGGYAEALEVIEAAHEALEVADAIAVGVEVGRNGDTVNDCVFVPEVIDHARILNEVRCLAEAICVRLLVVVTIFRRRRVFCHRLLPGDFL